MQRIFGLAAAAALLMGLQAAGQSVTFDFESGGDQGWGNKFADDASANFPIVNIGGSNRLQVLRNGDFQEAERASGNASEPFFMAMNAASNNEAGYLLSYDWYVNTAGGGYGTFLQLGSYVNTGSGYYAQNFPDMNKEVELSMAQLASGEVFSGRVTQTFAAKGFDLPAAQTFFRAGLIINGDGANANVYFDNFSIRPIPEPASIALLGLGVSAWCMARRRSSRR
jgi:hypothetical protein